MKEKVTKVLREFVQKLAYAKEPDPRDYCLGFTFQIPKEHEEISCYWLEAESNCEAKALYAKSVRCYNVEQLDKNIWKVQANDAYYILRVLGQGLKPANTHFVLAPYSPLENHEFYCAKVEFDSKNRMYTMPWYTNVVESYEIIKSQYADEIFKIKTTNHTIYYCLLLTDYV